MPLGTECDRVCGERLRNAFNYIRGDTREQTIRADSEKLASQNKACALSYQVLIFCCNLPVLLPANLQREDHWSGLDADHKLVV